MKSSFHLFGICDCSQWNSEYKKSVDSISRVSAECGRASSGTEHFNVRSFQTGQSNAIFQNFDEFVARVFDGKTQLLHAGKESIEMKVQTKESTVPDMCSVVCGIGMQKSIIKYGNLGLGNRNILTILKSDTFRILMGVLVASLDSWAGID